MLEALGPLKARPLHSLQQGAMLCDANKPGWPVVYVSTQWMRLLGLESHTVVGRKLWDVFEAPGAPACVRMHLSSMCLCRLRVHQRHHQRGLW